MPRLPRLALLGSLAFAWCAPAQSSASAQGWAGPTPPPRVSELEGGARLVLLELPELAASGRVLGRLVFRVGSVHEPSDKVGLCRLLAELLLQGGSVTQDGRALAAWLAERDARLETSAGLETIEIAFDTPAAHVEDLLAHVVGLLVSPAYPESGLAAARERLEDELEARERDLGRAADDLLARLALGSETPWSRAPTATSLGAVRRMDVLGFHRAWLGQSVLTLGLAWGGASADLAARAEQALSRLPRGAVPPAVDEPRFTQAGTTPLWIIDAPDAERVELRVATPVPVDEASVRALQLWVKSLNQRGGEDAALRSAQRRVRALRFEALEARRALLPFGWSAAGNAPLSEAVDACEALYDALSGHPRRSVAAEGLERIQRDLQPVLTPAERLAESARDVAAGLSPLARRDEREAWAAIEMEDVERAVHTRLNQRPPIVVVVGPARELYAPLSLLGPVSVHNALQRPRGTSEALALRARMLAALGGERRWARLVGTEWRGEVRSVGSQRPTPVACSRDMVRRWVRWQRDENGVPATIVATPTGGWLSTMRSVYDLPEARHARVLRHESRALEQVLHELVCNPSLDVRLGREGRLEVVEGDALRCWIAIADSGLPSALGFDDGGDDPGRMAYSDWREEQGYRWPGSVVSETDRTHYRWTRFTPHFTIRQREFDRPAR